MAIPFNCIAIKIKIKQICFFSEYLWKSQATMRRSNSVACFYTKQPLINNRRFEIAMSIIIISQLQSTSRHRYLTLFVTYWFRASRTQSLLVILYMSSFNPAWMPPTLRLLRHSQHSRTLLSQRLSVPRLIWHCHFYRQP